MAFLGMRGTGDWTANERPENWRQAMLFLYPNGQMPITAITSMMPSEPTDDPTYHWWTKTLPLQSGALTNVYVDSQLSSAYTAGAVTGTVLYVKVAEAVAAEFRPGLTAMLRKQDDYRHDTRGKVVGVVRNGANSFISFKLLHDADATYDIDEATHIKVIGSMNPEGATMPEPLAYNPVQYTNKTQIFRTSLSLTRTALRTRLRTPDQYQEAKREALELHGMEMEHAFIWGKQYEGIGSNGKPERSTGGLVQALIDNYPANVDAYHISADVAASTTWVNGGEDWLNEKLEVIYRYGSSEKLAVFGSGVGLAIQKLAKAGATINLVPGVVDYGIRVTTWHHQFGTLHLKTHPLFSHDPITRNDMLIVEPSNLRSRVIDDTFFVEDPMDRKNRNNSRDGRDEEFVTEIGMEWHNLPSMGYLSGFGITHV